MNFLMYIFFSSEKMTLKIYKHLKQCQLNGQYTAKAIDQFEENCSMYYYGAQTTALVFLYNYLGLNIIVFLLKTTEKRNIMQLLHVVPICECIFVC